MPLSKIQTIDNQVVPSLGSRNMIINGSFVVAQRGVTSSTTSGMQTVDRTYLVHSGTDNAPTQAQVDVASGTTPYSLGHRKAFKVTNGNQTSGAGAADYIQYEQQIEAQRVHSFGWDSTSTSSKITMSFWIKSSVARTIQGAFLVTDSSKIYPWNTGAISANTWTKVTKTIPGASGVTINNDTGIGLQWLMWPYLGTNYKGGSTVNQWNAHSSNTWGAATDDTTWYTTNSATCEITGLQIEVGSEATSFEHRDFDDELELCERYFQTYSNTLWQGTNEHSLNYSLYLDGYFRKRMRATPTATIVGTMGIGRPQVGVTQRPNSIGGLTEEGFYSCNWPSSGTYGGQLGSHGDAYYRMYVGAGPTNRLDFSAEL